MANIHEVAAALDGVLNAGNPEGLPALINAAAARAEIELRLAVGATAGSTTEEAYALRDRLYVIAGTLGELAGSARQGIEEKNALLARWGVTDNEPTGALALVSDAARERLTAVAAIPTAKPTALTVSRPEQPLRAEPIDECLTTDMPQMGPMRLSHLRARGVHTLRDALTAGAAYINNTANVGVKLLGPLQYRISEVCEGSDVADQQITHRPSVTQIAAMCTDLRQVSFAALQADIFTSADGLALGLSQRQVSVHDLITLSPDEIINCPDSIRSSHYDKERARAHFDVLVQRAQIFAREFDALKQNT